MQDKPALAPWIKRFLLEYLPTDRNFARNTQHSYRVVHHVSASQNENTFFPQERQALANFIMERRRLCFINGELNHWNVGLWIDVKQDRPGAMVEAPTIVAAHRCRCKQLLNALSKVGVTGGYRT